VRLPRPLIRLPFRFDAERLAAEVADVPEDAWLAHPSGLEGNSSLPLVSCDGGMNDDFGGRMLPTERLELCPYHRQVMASFGEIIGRSRLMRLAPGAAVSPHVDFNYHWISRVRIHVPVLTEPEVVFRCGGVPVHMAPGECWIFDSWRRHRVDHGGSRLRVHLVIDLSGSSRFWAMVRSVAHLDGRADAAEIDARSQRLEYVPGQRPELETERFNVAPVMAPGEVDAIVAEIVAEFEANARNDGERMLAYRLLLEDFAHDWRQLWQRHGPDPAGRPHYEALIERVRAGLAPDPRALLTGSNEVGVNPVVVQRLLRAALQPQEWERYLATTAGATGS
jgi:hypothetical protein